MLETPNEDRAPGRRAGRWIGVVAMAAVIGLGAVGCTADIAALSKKSEGEGVVEVGPMPDIDPASIEGIAHGTASQEQGVELIGSNPEVLPQTVLPPEGLQASRETTGSFQRVHLTLASAEKITMLGNTIKGAEHECWIDGDEDKKEGMGLPRVVDHVDPMGLEQSCVDGYGEASVQATYRIGDSPYLFWTYARTGFFGQNEVKCSILNAKDWTENKSSPYSCTYQWLQDGSFGPNPMPKLKLWKKPDITVTDPKQVQEILSANCKTAGPNCVFDAKVQRFESLPKKQWILYGNAQGNCIAGSHASLKVGDEQEVSWKKMIGVTAMGEMEIGPVKAGLEATYEYAWSASQVFKEEHEMTIPEGKIAGFYIAAGVLHVEGDFTVKTNSATYLLPNAVFNLPLTEDYRDGDTVIQKGPIMPVAWPCPASGNLGAEQAPEYGIPDGAEVLEQTKTN